MAVRLGHAGLEGCDEGALVNHAILKREQSEEEMAVCCDGSHWTFLQAWEAARLRSIPRDGSVRAAVVPYQME